MRIGLDVGSTTIKAVAVDEYGRLVFSDYMRHYSRINEMAKELLLKIKERFPQEKEVKIAISGSAGMGLADKLGVPFVQEVYATKLCAKKLIPDADVIIELGGEDAKILFLEGVADCRMNGSCAGGTGAFIDQMATLLKITPSTLNGKAADSQKIYKIASRCGVFAKSDVQPLINQGAKLEDVCVSILYSVVNQTVAGLAQGRPISGSVYYLGGPLTFMSELRNAFDGVLKLSGKLPEHSLYFVAAGAAHSASDSFDLGKLTELISREESRSEAAEGIPLFEDNADYEAFLQRHARAKTVRGDAASYTGKAYLGIDAGSTTTKLAVIGDSGELLLFDYRSNSGNPVPIIKAFLEDFYNNYPHIELAGAIATGYGADLCNAAFNADGALVETMAHFKAAKHFLPEVDFIIDIGGQDMKCFKIEDGAVSDIFLNEACSSGCGSFLQTFAEALGSNIEDFARLGLYGKAPVELGSRCTVFMNSSVKQAQKDGATIENISAGLALSVVKNALYKVIRMSSAAGLGKNIVVQGGTFLNDAVLRAFEREIGCEVVRPDIAGLMGAFGAALHARDVSRGKSAILRQEGLSNFFHTVSTVSCNLCTNKCPLTVNKFDGGRKYISGNRCERPVTKAEKNHEYDIYEYKKELLKGYTPVKGKRGAIAMPLALNFYETLPFWHTLFTSLGFEVYTSPESTPKMYYRGQSTIPSDTVCYPAKLMHGHINELAKDSRFNVIFYPCMTYNIDENISDNKFNCPVVAYYPEVINSSCGELDGKTFIYDYVGIHRPKDFPKKFYLILKKYFKGISLKEVKVAARAAYFEYDVFLAKIRQKGAEIIKKARKNGKNIIVLAGRPYHVDGEVNHGINTLISGQGAAVISEDSISHYMEKSPAKVLNQWTYHARLYSAARFVCTQEDMNLVQLVSFSCGLDAVTTDEVREILRSSGKIYTQIKIDEIANLGAANIRIKSLFAAINDTERVFDEGYTDESGQTDESDQRAAV